MLDLPEIVDLNRYPVADTASDAAQALIARCRRDLDEQALCTLPGFVRPAALATMAEEASAAAPSAYRKNNLRTPYGWLCNAGFPEGHPRAALHLTRCGFIMTHQLEERLMVSRLFHWDPLTTFVREVLGYDTLHRSACPNLSLVVSVMDQDDELAWHYDSNDGVVSLLLQGSDEGGQFEYAPYSRSESDENYPLMTRLFADEPGVSRRPAMAPGTFVLFKGHRSCHRVTRIGATTKPRMIALFSYDREPGMVFPKTSVQDLMSPTTEPYRGQPEPAGSN